MTDWYYDNLFLLHLDGQLCSAPDATPGEGLDPEQLRRVLSLVRPDAVQYTAKGHAGFVPYRTQFGNELTTLGEFWHDVLRTYREVTQELEIRLVLGYSGLIDYHAADWRPDWQRVRTNYASYPNRALCPNSGYVEELMLPQLAELVELYSPDGFWIDADNWTVSPCYCTACESEFRMRHGRSMPTEPRDPFWPEWLQFHRDSFNRYVGRVARYLHERSAELVYASNGAYAALQAEPCPEGPDRLTRDPSPAFSLRQAGLEARFFGAREMPFDLMTWTRTSARPWPGRTPALPAYPKSADQLCQEGAVILANGGRWSVWMTPDADGWLPEAEAETAAKAAEFARARTEWCRGTESAAYVAVLHSDATHRKAGNGLYDPGPSLDRVRGAHQALLELHHPHDVVNEEDLVRHLDRYHVVVLPEQTALPLQLDERLAEWVLQGGCVIASGRVSPRNVEEIPTFALEEVLGVRWTGRQEPEGWVLYEGRPLHLAAPVYPVAVQTAEVVLPLLESGRSRSPVLTGYPAATRNVLGEGDAYYLATDFFAAYHRCQYPGLRDLFGSLLARALPKPPLSTDAPPTVEIVLRRREGAILAHLVEHSPGRSLAENNAFVEQVPWTEGFTLRLGLPEQPAAVQLEPGGAEPEWSYEGASLQVRVPSFHLLTSVVVSVGQSESPASVAGLDEATSSGRATEAPPA